MPRFNPNCPTRYFLFTACFVMPYSFPERWRWGITKMTQQSVENDVKLQTDRDKSGFLSFSEQTRGLQRASEWESRDSEIKRISFHPSHLYQYEMTDSQLTGHSRCIEPYKEDRRAKKVNWNLKKKKNPICFFWKAVEWRREWIPGVSAAAACSGYGSTCCTWGFLGSCHRRDPSKAADSSPDGCWGCRSTPS